MAKWSIAIPLYYLPSDVKLNTTTKLLTLNLTSIKQK